MQDYSFSEGGVDRGIGSIYFNDERISLKCWLYCLVREKSKHIIELLSDESQLKEERENAKKTERENRP